MAQSDIETEKQRLIAEFPGADGNKLRALDPLIEQAAYERLYLKRLNDQAIKSGLVKFHPNDPSKQRTLPVSAEISRHAASLTNIMDKLMKHLSVDQTDDDDGLGDYE